jgi:oligoendopeptidase F
VGAVFAKFDAATAWFTPELLTLPEATCAWLDSHAGAGALPPHHPGRVPPPRPCAGREGRTHPVAGRPHQRRAAHGLRGAQHLGHQVPDADLQRRPDRHAVPGAYAALLESNPNQADRAKAAEAHLGTYGANAATYAAIYKGVLERDWFMAQARNFNSTLDAALHGNNIPRAWSRTWSPPARAGTAPLQRYIRLRQKLLGLKEYHTYDNFQPLFRTDKRYPYPDARELVLASVAPLGEEYGSRYRRFLAGGRIDVYESEGKRSGAYNAGVYGVGPYLLLNHNDTMDAMFTLAHEAGHAMHTVLSYEHQPFVTADYTIFVAEVASTTNERFLLEHLLQPDHRPEGALPAAAARGRPDRQHLLHAVDVRRLRAAGAPTGGTGPARHRRGAERALPAAVEGLLRRRAGRSTTSTSSPGRASRTSSTRPTTCTSTRPASRRRRRSSRR